MTMVKSVDAQTAKIWLTKQQAIIVDVREPEEYATSHINGSTLIPLGLVEKNKLPASENKKIIIHCHSGKRSHMACEKLLAEDPNLDLYNLEGGILAWQQAGL